MPTGDDHTAVTAPPATWDGDAREGDEDSVAEAPRITAATAVIQPAEYELAPGTKLGEYQIESKLGEGGMGVVFAAVHPLIGKRAAIKILKRELCADPQTVGRFIDEARVVNQIGHPNIVDIFAFGEMPDGRSYFVMEWLKGDTLRARIAAGKMELPEMSRIVRQLARALQAAHDKGVIHRDLKPDNIFLVEMTDEPITVKLLDFGIAKLARNDQRIEKTATGAIVGTPQYIAPEQAKGYTIDHRADIYALGGIMFEMLTGRPPFVADNAMEIVAKHLMETPVRVSTLAPDVSPELDELVDQMLSKQPEKRPPLAKVVEVLDAARVRGDLSLPVIRPSNDALVAAPVSMPAFDTPSVKRSRPPWIAIAGVPIAALVAFLIVRALNSSSDEPARPEPKPEPPAKVAVVAPPPPEKVAPPPPKVAVKVETPKVNIPPVAAPPVVPKARLRLNVLNGGPGTDIRIDGALASADTLLPYGVHNVEIRSKGMVPQRFTVEIGKGGTAKRVMLEAKEPKVRPPKKPPVETDPDDDKGLIKPGTLKSK
jgi:serine/threonine protein kinase